MLILPKAVEDHIKETAVFEHYGMVNIDLLVDKFKLKVSREDLRAAVKRKFDKDIEGGVQFIETQ